MGMGLLIIRVEEGANRLA